MSMNYQPPPPKTTGTGTIFGVLALVFVGIPILLCLVGGFAIWGLAGFPGAVSKASAWRSVVAEKQRLHREFIDELRTIAAANNNTIPPTELTRITQRAHEIDRKVNALAAKTSLTHGKCPEDIRLQILDLEDIRSFVATLNNNNHFLNMLADPVGGPPMNPNASMQAMNEQAGRARAEMEQRMAQQRVEDQQRLARLDAERQQREQQRLAEQQAREQRLREFANVVPNNPPPVFNQPPPVFNQPPPVNPQPVPGNPGGPAPQQSGANEPPPGFPATDLAQVKPRDVVFVQAGGQWVQALVQLKRGKLVQVRSPSGDIAVVMLEQIRLQNEPTAKAESNLPPALRSAEGSKTTAKKDEEADDALFVAKPPGDQAKPQESPSAVPAQPAANKPVAPTAEYRTWTNDTGEFKVEAELVNFEFDLVQLRRRDGKVLSLRLEKLSAEDQKVVREKFK